MKDRTLRRQSGSAGLPITIVLWCLSAGGVATFVAPAFDVDNAGSRSGHETAANQRVMEPVREVVALDDRRGLRRSLTELLPDYLVEVGASEGANLSEERALSQTVIEDDSPLRSVASRPMPSLTPQVSIKAPELVVPASSTLPVAVATLEANPEPVTEELEALVKSVGQPVAAPAYVAIPAISPALDVAKQASRIPPGANERELARSPQAEVVDEDSSTLPSIEPRIESVPAKPVCVSAPTCLAVQKPTAVASRPGQNPADLNPRRRSVPAAVVAQSTSEVHKDLLLRVTDKLRNGDHASAYQLFRQQLRSGRGVSWSGRSLELYAISALGAGAYREAAISYEKLIDAEPRASKWWLGLAAARQAIGQDVSELFAHAAVLAQPASLVAER